MRFSIVTVSFNAGAVIGRAMQSLQAQSFTDYEWLVVDGGSTDDTLAVTGRFTGPNMRSVSERDEGIYDAMNKGVAMARGEYLFFLNADDQLADAQVLADLHREIARVPADLLIGRILHETQARRTLRDFSHLDKAALMMDTLCHQAVFARREMFQRVGGFDLRYRMAADYDWFIRCFNAGCSRQFMPRLVTVFNGEGAHAKAQARTRAEIEAVRRQHAGAVGAGAYAVWRHLRHYRRRLAGQPPLGFLPA